MKEVVIQIPTYEAEQNIEIDVHINGKKIKKRFRVEIIAFEEEEDTSEERIAVLKRVIKEHDKEWKLVQIGLPAENRISVMFQQKHDTVEKE
jgi:RNase H-fold protein (predicted Holliday junction resolvase)